MKQTVEQRTYDAEYRLLPGFRKLMEEGGPFTPDFASSCYRAFASPSFATETRTKVRTFATRILNPFSPGSIACPCSVIDPLVLDRLQETHPDKGRCRVTPLSDRKSQSPISTFNGSGDDNPLQLAGRSDQQSYIHHL